MTARKRDISGMPFWPRLLSREEAAAYLGISPSLFEQKVNLGMFPLPLSIGTRKLWDRHKLDESVNVLAGVALGEVRHDEAPRSDYWSRQAAGRG